MTAMVVRNGAIVGADGAIENGWLLVRDGRIAAVGSGDEPAEASSAEAIDAGGRPVLPGLIDTHFHVGFHDPERDFETETRSAALGGVTTVCRYYRHLGSYETSVAEEIALGERTSHVDFAFHLGLLTDEQLAGVDRWISELGIRSFKMYTCYKDDQGAALGIRGQDDGFLLDAFRRLAAAGNVVANVHCENQEIVDRETRRRSGTPSAAGRDLADWSAARPPIAEAEAIRRVAFLAREAGAELFIPHVSSDAALHAIVGARSEGTTVHGETCPHYLALDADAPAGVLAKINPPIRPRGEAHELWASVADRTIDVVGTDHGTVMRAAKVPGDPWRSAPGFAGVGTLLRVLLDGVAAGRIELRTIARLQAAAADIFRLGRKGRLEPGCDADFVIVDPDREETVDAAALGSASDFSVFDGMRLRGVPLLTVLRGRVIAREGSPIAGPGTGRYIAR